MLTFCCGEVEDCKGEIPEWCHLVDISPEYDPVCGCDEVTYHNSVAAECNGISEYVEGECESQN